MEEIEIYNLGDTRTCKAALTTVIKCLVDTILGGKTIKLKRLLLKPGCLLSPAVRLATALNKIEILEVQLFHEDLNLLFKAMMQGETSVTSLSSLWGHLYLSELDPESFFGVFDKLKEFGIISSENVPTEPSMVATFFEKIASGTNFKTLRLRGSFDLSQVNGSLLRRMVTQLEDLDLWWLDVPSIVKIVTAIATTETSNLRKLKISSDMRSVDKCLLAKMARKVEDLTLECAVQDVIWVFEAMAKFGTRKLRRIRLIGWSTNLDELDPDILATVVNNLECFEFSSHSFLTVNQTENILSLALKTKSHLRRLHICVRGSTSNLDPLVREAEKIIPDLNVRYSSFPVRVPVTQSTAAILAGGPK